MMLTKGLGLMTGALLVILLVCLLVEEWRIGALKTNLTAQTTRAERAEEKVIALETSAAYRATQILALQGQAAQCEEARSQEAANAAERRAITERARAALPQPQAAQGGATPPRDITNGGSAHEATRRAVAVRLNRPL